MQALAAQGSLGATLRLAEAHIKQRSKLQQSCGSKALSLKSFYNAVAPKAQKGSRLAANNYTFQEENVIDQDFLEELNKVSNQTLEVLSSCQEAKAQQLSSELAEMQHQLEDVGDQASIQFLNVLRGFLDHKVPRDIENLGGMYSRAADRILNQVSGSDWALHEEGVPNEKQEPQFSSWDDVMNGKKGGGHPGSTSAASSVKDDTYYRLLQVEPSASQKDIKAAFRRLALKLHPDVNQEADATERFAELSAAYDVLSDEESRRMYDLHGLDISSYSQGAPGRGNAREAWDEFKPFKKENKRTRARDAVRTRSSPETASSSRQAPENDGSGPDEEADSLPQVGDIVEYPLRAVETEDFQDGRSHGVGLLVGRNIDRGDAAKLPEEQLDLCEIESLRQEEPSSNRWIADDLGIPSFAKLNELTVVPVEEFDKRFGIWTIESELSPGCGGPPLPEEIIL